MSIWLAPIVFIAICTSIVFLLRQLERRRLCRRSVHLDGNSVIPALERPRAMAELARVKAAIGECYGVDPKCIQSTDTISTFSALDSWVLGRGAERLERWLADQGCVDASPSTTVVELADLVARGDPRSDQNI